MKSGDRMIKKVCLCGKEYKFRDQFRGSFVKCPICEEEFYVDDYDPYFEIFSRDIFLINQKHFSVSEKYHVMDEDQSPLFYVKRPNKVIKIIGMLSIIIILTITLAPTIAKYKDFSFIFVLATFLIGYLLSFVVLGKRNIFFYKDPQFKNLILRVEQKKLLEIPKGIYEVYDHNEQLLARLENNNLTDIFRKRWYWYDTSGNFVAIIREESFILSFFRRFLGNFYGVLRMNFVYKTTDLIDFGTFNRKQTIADKYILDLSNDPDRIYNRRVCVALGVLLDTGERR